MVHLDKEEEMQKLPLQPPYYDMAPSESTPFTDKPVSSDAMSRFKGASMREEVIHINSFGPAIIAGKKLNFVLCAILL